MVLLDHNSFGKSGGVRAIDGINNHFLGATQKLCEILDLEHRNIAQVKVSAWVIELHVHVFFVANTYILHALNVILFS